MSSQPSMRLLRVEVGDLQHREHGAVGLKDEVLALVNPVSGFTHIETHVSFFVAFVETNRGPGQTFGELGVDDGIVAQGDHVAAEALLMRAGVFELHSVRVDRTHGAVSFRRFRVLSDEPTKIRSTIAVVWTDDVHDFSLMKLRLVLRRDNVGVRKDQDDEDGFAGAHSRCEVCRTVSADPNQNVELEAMSQSFAYSSFEVPFGGPKDLHVLDFFCPEHAGVGELFKFVEEGLELVFLGHRFAFLG